MIRTQNLQLISHLIGIPIPASLYLEPGKPTARKTGLIICATSPFVHEALPVNKEDVMFHLREPRLSPLALAVSTHNIAARHR